MRKLTFVAFVLAFGTNNAAFAAPSGYSQKDVQTLATWADASIKDYAKSRLSWFVAAGHQQDAQAVLDDLVRDPARAQKKYFSESVLLPSNLVPLTAYRLSHDGILILGDEGKKGFPTIKITRSDWRGWPGFTPYHTFRKNPRGNDWTAVATYGWKLGPDYASKDGNPMVRLVVDAWTWDGKEPIYGAYGETPAKALEALIKTPLTDVGKRGSLNPAKVWNYPTADMIAKYQPLLASALASDPVESPTEYELKLVIPPTLSARQAISNLLWLSIQRHGELGSTNEEQLFYFQFEKLWKDLFVKAIQRSEPVEHLLEWIERVRKAYKNGDTKTWTHRYGNERLEKGNVGVRVLGSASQVAVVSTQCEAYWGDPNFSPASHTPILAFLVMVYRINVLYPELKRYGLDTNHYWVEDEEIGQHFPLTLEEERTGNLDRVRSLILAKAPPEIKKALRERLSRVSLPRMKRGQYTACRLLR